MLFSRLHVKRLLQRPDSVINTTIIYTPCSHVNRIMRETKYSKQNYIRAQFKKSRLLTDCPFCVKTTDFQPINFDQCAVRMIGYMKSPKYASCYFTDRKRQKDTALYFIFHQPYRQTDTGLLFLSSISLLFTIKCTYVSCRWRFEEERPPTDLVADGSVEVGFGALQVLVQTTDNFLYTIYACFGDIKLLITYILKCKQNS